MNKTQNNNRSNFVISINNDIFQNTELVNTTTDIVFSSISIDSRTIQPDEMFIAIKGLNFDGNDYAKASHENGASVVVVNKRNTEIKCPTIIVEDSINFLEKLAQYNRKINKGKFIGITGSFGKTTTKEILNKTISTKYTTHSTKKNLNNYIGLPLTIANSPIETTEYNIIEIGISNPNEMQKKAEMLLPNIAVITSVGLMHAGNFEKREDIANNKYLLLEYLVGERNAVINSSGPLSEIVIKNARLNKNINQIITYGINDYDDIQILEKESINQEKIIAKVRVFNEIISYTMPTMSEAVVLNSLAAFGVGSLLKINNHDIIKSLSDFQGTEGRGKIIPIKIKNHWIYVIDDCYNAGPDPLVNGIKTIKNITKHNNGRKILIISSFKDTGIFEKEIYENITKYIADIDLVIGIDQNVIQQLPKSINKKFLSSPEEISLLIKETSQKNDTILIKGSRDSKLERIISALMEKQEQ